MRKNGFSVLLELREQKQLQAYALLRSNVLLPSQFLLIMIYVPFYNNSIYHVVDEKLENIADCSINEVRAIMQKLNPNKSHTGLTESPPCIPKKTVCFATGTLSHISAEVVVFHWPTP